MKIQENITLKDFTTLRIGGQARYFTVVKNEAELREALFFAKVRKLPIFVLGGGSNILVSDSGFPGLLVKNEIKGVKFIDKSQDKVRVEIGAGENLDEIINLIILRKLSGLENLSGIPGTVGGAAVQNAGAYGVELKDCLVSVEGLNSTNGRKFILSNTDCRYSYRNSFFKKNKKFIITLVVFGLNKIPILNTSYTGLKKVIKESQELNALDIREAVLKIRAEKLPDWRLIGTAGSFFKNPIITNNKYLILKKKFIELPGFPEPYEKVKLPLAWILDKICGLNGYKIGNVGLYEKQPIVLVNYGRATEKKVTNFAKKILENVRKKINLNIEWEVEKI